MKTNKKVVKTIVSNTIIFIAVLLFVALFKVIFGDENTSIGISTIVLSLTLLSRDLTNKPVKNFMFLLGFNIITIGGAYIFEFNLWLGLIINFVIMAGIGYLFSYEVKKPFNMLFGLQYILIIGSPITIGQLPMRLIAGLISVCIIMVLQLAINKKKLAKTSKKILLLMEEKILLKINLIKENNSTEEVDKDIYNLINKFKLSIFESGQTDFKMSNYGNISIDILSCIEKINDLLDNIKVKELKEEVLNDFYTEFENVKNEKFNLSIIEDVLSRHEEDLVIVNEFLSVFEILQQKVQEFKVIASNTGDYLGNNIAIAEDFNPLNWHKNNFKNMNYRVAYGLRLGILFALTGFVTKFFDLEFGKWMMFTVFALTQPYAEFSYIKTKKRVFGTTIGVLIIFISFLIIKDNSVRMIILLTAGYLLSYFDDYKYRAILITICATCTDAVSHENPFYVILCRLIFVAIGVVISLMANKFLFSRKCKDAEVDLINMQKQSSNRMVQEVILSNNTNENSIRHLLLVPTLIENRIDTLDLDIKRDFLYKNKSLANDLYQIYLSSNRDYKNLFNNIINDCDIKSAKKKLKEQVKKTSNLREKALIISIIDILKNAYDTNKEAEKLEKLKLTTK